MFGRLSTKEIDRALQKIREEYDHLMVHFMQGPEARNKFEYRLKEALRTRFDMTTFLGLEVQVVRDLLAQAEEEMKQREIEAARVKKPVQSYADFVLAQQREKIKDYPALDLHPEASPDVAKLYGALDWFRGRIWSVVLPVLREKDPQVENLMLEDEMASLTPYQGRLPKELDSYCGILRGQSTLSQVSKAQNRCILLGAQHLHRLARRLGQARLAKLTPREKELVDRSAQFVEKMIQDFRLKDLKPAEARS